MRSGYEPHDKQNRPSPKVRGGRFCVAERLAVRLQRRYDRRPSMNQGTRGSVAANKRVRTLCVGGSTRSDLATERVPSSAEHHGK
jgi:hypothetical protein